MKSFTVDELEDMAIRQDPLPELQSQAQVLLYQSLRNLYWYARQSGVSREQGAMEKQRILDSYRVNKFLEDLQESTNRMWKQIDIASAEYRKNPSVENADRLMKAIYRVERVKPMESGGQKNDN